MCSSLVMRNDGLVWGRDWTVEEVGCLAEVMEDGCMGGPPPAAAAPYSSVHKLETTGGTGSSLDPRACPNNLFVHRIAGRLLNSVTSTSVGTLTLPRKRGDPDAAM